jgi:protein-S-isoprenylcysteine O-methyltransferase Ste14
MVLSNFVGFLFASGWWIIVAVVLAMLLIVLAIRNREALLETVLKAIQPDWNALRHVSSVGA